jgi:peptidyl-dipeptidase Dcp
MSNPLLSTWTAHYGLPPFDQIKPAHFASAFDAAMTEQNRELDAIEDNANAATFENTIVAFDRHGRKFAQVSMCFGNLAASETSDELQAVERELAPKLAAHSSSIFLREKLFARIDALYEQREGLGLSAVDRRMLERVHKDFVLAGAKLPANVRERYKAIVTESAELTTAFSQNVLADEGELCVYIDDEKDLAGLSAAQRASMAQAAEARGQKGKWAVAMSHSSVGNFLTFAQNRALREKVYKAWATRGEINADRDTRKQITQILKLRTEQAKLHGYRTFSDYALSDTMAKTPAAVQKLLEQVWVPAKAKLAAERAEVEALAKADGIEFKAWDWIYYADQLKRKKFNLDDAEVKPYFSLDRMIEAMFDCASKLFEVKFIEQKGIPMYHADVRVFEVRALANDALIGVFIGDNYARPSKRGGAWMSSFRLQSGMNGGTTPLVVNNNNFAKPEPGAPCLLSFDDVRTLFHEFGHGLHGLLSKVQYERLAGTSVLQDFVELPSQLYEHWALERDVLKKHALHFETGEPIPDALIAKLEAARKVNQGVDSVRYCSSALVDLALHQETFFEGFDVNAFEAATLKRFGMPGEIDPRHRLVHFRHLFSGDYYASKYYVYLWAEVLDADAFDAFKEANDIFDKATAQRLLENIYSAGDTREPGELYRAFRGRDASVKPMLKKKGLLEA